MSAAAGGIGGLIGGPGMLSGATGKEVANITTAGIVAKYLGLKSGQEIAKQDITRLLIKASGASTL